MSSRGFSLIEVLVAVALLVVAVLGVAQLVAVAVSATAVARVQSLTVTLASARVEELRALRHDFDASGTPSSDVNTDLSTATPLPGGTGLTPGGSIDTSIAGYVDHLDRIGQWVANSTTPPRDAAYTRRWAVTASPLFADVLVLDVAVFPIVGGAMSPRGPGSARFVTLIGRTLR